MPQSILLAGRADAKLLQMLLPRAASEPSSSTATISPAPRLDPGTTTAALL